MGGMPVTYTDDLRAIDFPALVGALEADAFHNGRTPDELRLSCARSHAVTFARDAGETVGMARLLSDGVCNAYLVDVWTATPHRRQGIASAMVRRLLATVPGQHVALFTEHAEALYASLGFHHEEIGMSLVMEPWLRR
jgi:predicted GNAT family acetyltransferase